MADVDALVPVHPVRQNEFAKMLGVEPPAVNRLIRLGKLTPPALTETRQIMVAEAMKQLGRPLSDLRLGDQSIAMAAEGEAKRRNLTAERDELNVELKRQQLRQAELETAELERRLVDAAAVERAVERRAVGLRMRLVGMAGEMSPQLARMRDPLVLEKALVDAIEVVLQADADEPGEERDA